MLHHVVLFKLKAEATDQAVDDAMTKLRALKGQIVEVEAIAVGRDIVGRPVSATFGLTSQFEDREALGRYLANPLHVAAVDSFRSLIDQQLVWDYESSANAA